MDPLSNCWNSDLIARTHTPAMSNDDEPSDGHDLNQTIAEITDVTTSQLCPSLRLQDQFRQRQFIFPPPSLTSLDSTSSEQSILRAETLKRLLQAIEENPTLANIEALSRDNLTMLNGFTKGEALHQTLTRRGLKYNDIFPWDWSIVSRGEKFVNANFITLNQKVYIASEAPRPQDFGNFWNMVWEQANIIVMLTELIEQSGFRKIIKAHTYWPRAGEEATEPFVPVGGQEQLKVRYLSETKIFPTENITTSTLGAIGKQFIVEYRFQMRKGDQTKEVTLLHYRHLLDSEAPSTENHLCFEHLIENITQLEATYPENKTIVHCSAGVGRTGMLLACLDLKNKHEQGQIFENPDLAVATSIIHQRIQRNYMVQTRTQFEFINSYLKKIQLTK